MCHIYFILSITKCTVHPPWVEQHWTLVSWTLVLHRGPSCPSSWELRPADRPTYWTSPTVCGWGHPPPLAPAPLDRECHIMSHNVTSQPAPAPLTDNVTQCHTMSQVNLLLVHWDRQCHTMSHNVTQCHIMSQVNLLHWTESVTSCHTMSQVNLLLVHWTESVT